MEKVQAGSDLMLFPFSRNAEREDKFGWLQKLFTNSLEFVSAPGTQPINTLDQAEELPMIGVLAGTPWGKFLTDHHVANVKEYPTSPAIVAALVSGDLKAGFGPAIELKYSWRIGGYQGAMVEGQAVQKVDQYLAMSKDSPSIKPEDWHEAFTALEQDGTFDRIYASYFGSN
jgi:ABC-type amino acid transport substrate-binding protein